MPQQVAKDRAVARQSAPEEPLAESIHAAKSAGLVYVCDDRAGIRRVGSSKNPRYVSADNRPVTDKIILARIKRLAIPPAWTEVWICPKQSGKFHQIDIRDHRLAKIVSHCQAIPGQELFQYVDERGKPRDITSTDVNEYLREITRSDFTAKDFRTWGGTVLAAMALQEFEKFDTKTQAKKNLMRAIEAVAQRLGTTPAICRKCYIHPEIMNAYLEGTMLETFQNRAEQQLRNIAGLSAEEGAVLAFLQKRLAAEQRNRRSTLFEKLESSVKHRRKR